MTHEFAEDERIVEVGVLVGVLDDVRLNGGVSERYLDTRRLYAEELEAGHVTNTPAHDLHTTAPDYQDYTNKNQA